MLVWRYFHIYLHHWISLLPITGFAYKNEICCFAPLVMPKATSASNMAALLTQRWPLAMTKATYSIAKAL